MKKPVVLVSLMCGFLVFIGVSIATKLFDGADLPVQISGALFDAVITALMTYFLLAGQIGHEEVKERNVKVFEEKSARFNKFIDKLWSVWDDHSNEEWNAVASVNGKRSTVNGVCFASRRAMTCFSVRRFPFTVDRLLSILTS
jgi:hypothetical protein